MKKILLKILVILFLIPISVNALTYSNVDYDITDYYINANILENGDCEVSEMIALKGTFNGYIRDILYRNSLLNDDNFASSSRYNASNLEIIKIEAKDYSGVLSFANLDDLDYVSLKKNYDANLGYTITPLNDGLSLKMYYATKGKAIFKITYLLKDVAVLHNDVAEFYWNFIGNNYDDDLHNVNIKVNLPGSDKSSNFRFWAHGDLAGEIKKIDDSSLIASINNLDAYNSLDIRITFAKELLDEENVAKTTNMDALDSILKVEEERAAIANQERQKIKRTYYGIKALTYLWYLALIITFIYVYFKYDKERKSPFTNKYNREFIDDYNVEVVNYLMNNKHLNENALTASIMNLVYKKIIKLEEIPNGKKKDYQFTLINQAYANETENYLIDFLFNKVGSNNAFTTSDLKKYASSTKTCESFNSSYTKWKNKVIVDSNKQQFFEEKKQQIIWGVIFLITGILIFYLNIFWMVESLLGLLILIPAIMFFIYTIVFTKKTEKGIEHYSKWKAFKNFLNDFGTFETKELPEIILWERYLVYASVFGLADKVSKVMNVKIKELETSGVYASYYPTFTDYYVFNHINNVIRSTINANQTAITRERANSSYSSGSGFGGGFSSGGGFGGGGGGGRGF